MSPKGPDCNTLGTIFYSTEIVVLALWKISRQPSPFSVWVQWNYCRWCFISDRKKRSWL